MEQVLNFLLSIFGFPLQILSRIEFFGTNLLEFLISLLVIGVMLPIVLSLGKSVLRGTNPSDSKGGK